MRFLGYRADYGIVSGGRKKKREIIGGKILFRSFLSHVFRKQPPLSMKFAYEFGVRDGVLCTFAPFLPVLQLKSPYIESFLKYTATLQPDSMAILELLWRYYERNKIYLPAAKIQDTLAHQKRCLLACVLVRRVVLLGFGVWEYYQK